MILGTPNYMSPEQTDSSRDTLTPSSDIFSAGIILYQMMTGIQPFSSMDETKEIMAQVRNFNPAPIHKINSDVPLRLSKICERMLEKKSSLRYYNLKEVIEDINEFYNSGQAFYIRTYQPGETIFNEGEVGRYFFKILSGKVEISKRVNGKHKVLAELGKNEFVGELAIFTNQPRTATVKSIEPTAIRIMEKVSVEKELEKLSPWVGGMITGLSKRFIKLNEKVIELESKMGSET